MLNWPIFAFILVFLYAGYKKGLFASAVTFFSVFFAILLTLNFFEALARGIAGLIERTEPYSQGIAFLGLFLFVYTILYMLANTFLIESFKVRQLINAPGGLFLASALPFLWWGY